MTQILSWAFTYLLCGFITILFIDFSCLKRMSRAKRRKLFVKILIIWPYIYVRTLIAVARIIVNLWLK